MVQDKNIVKTISYVMKSMQVITNEELIQYLYRFENISNTHINDQSVI